MVIDPELDKADDYAGVAHFSSRKCSTPSITHTHADHNSACKIMRERYGIKSSCTAPPTLLSGPAGWKGDDIKFGQQALKVVHTRRPNAGCDVPALQGSNLYRRYC